MEEYTADQAKRMLSTLQEHYSEHCESCWACREGPSFCDLGEAICRTLIRWSSEMMRLTKQEARSV